MIEIAEVCPNVRESRSIQRGWGAIHWVCIVPTYAFLFGFLIFGLLVMSARSDDVPDGAFSVSIIGSWLLWWFGSLWLRKTIAAEARKAPVGGLPWRWTIDDEGISFANGLQTNRLDWRAVRSVREEKDRVLFLVSPAYNPVLPTRLLDAGQLDALRELIGALKASSRLGGGVDYRPTPTDKA